MTLSPLAVSQLYQAADAQSLPTNTRRLKAFNDFLGQERAKEAVHMALAMPHDGYNIFAIGENGLGKTQVLNLFYYTLERNFLRLGEFNFKKIGNLLYL